MKLTIATCQFPVDGDVNRNLRHIQKQMRRAHAGGAQVAHFSECCLGGYAGIEFPSFDGYNWELLREATERVMVLAKQFKLWVILGSHHQLSNGHKPHNSLYIIDDRGRLIDRYDKLFCTGNEKGTDGDLLHYTPGDHFVTFEIRGVRCGVLICHDFRYQELYREYKKRGVQLMFHSYHNGHMARAAMLKQNNIWGTIVPPTMQAYAANNYMWISANNTTRRESCWPSFFVHPDGAISGRLVPHLPGVLFSTVDTREKFYDACSTWRPHAMRGIYHSGTLVRDARSKRRTEL